MPWWLYAAFQWFLAHVPGGRRIHNLLQSRFGELAHLERSTRFENAEYFLRTARRWCGELGDLRIVELGTGWVPIIPLALLLAGARVDTYDVAPLARPRLFVRTRDEARRRLNGYADAAGLPPAVVQQRADRIEGAPDLASAFRTLGGRYVAPCDTRDLPYADGAVDLVVSNLVLSCIDPPVLEEVLRESFRVLRPGGVAIHRLRMTDEYAREDPRRNHLAYLRYSDEIWNRWFRHELKWLNRLRASQFLGLFERVGFHCRSAHPLVDKASIPFLRTLDVAPEFRGLDLEDLATINLDVVLQKPPVADVADAQGEQLAAAASNARGSHSESGAERDKRAV